jgi:hypothetical protein
MMDQVKSYKEDGEATVEVHMLQLPVRQVLQSP